MFKKRTTLLAASLAIAAAAVAVPEQAASSDGANVTKVSDCTTDGGLEVCRSGTEVRNDVSTPSGIMSSTSSSHTYQAGQPGGDAIRTRMNSHSLDRNGVSIEVGQHYAQTTGRCTDREDSQQVRGNLKYNREVYYCK